MKRTTSGCIQKLNREMKRLLKNRSCHHNMEHPPKERASLGVWGGREPAQPSSLDPSFVGWFRWLVIQVASNL
eukprot:1528806-Amphidinium_carterae.1